MDWVEKQIMTAIIAAWGIGLPARLRDIPEDSFIATHEPHANGAGTRYNAKKV